jgi:ribonuclease R
MANRRNKPQPRSFTPRPPNGLRPERSDRPARPDRPDRPTPPAAGAGLRNSETFEATFLGHPEGAGGFLRPANARKNQRMDVLVDWREGHGAIHGDKVQAEITGTTYDGRPKAKVVKVLSRNPDPIPALLQKQEWGWRAIPLEPRLSQIVSVPQTDLAGDGDLVSVLLDPDPLAQQIRGTVQARLGRPT